MPRNGKYTHSFNECVSLCKGLGTFCFPESIDQIQKDSEEFGYPGKLAVAVADINGEEVEVATQKSPSWALACLYARFKVKPRWKNYFIFLEFEIWAQKKYGFLCKICNHSSLEVQGRMLPDYGAYLCSDCHRRKEVYLQNRRMKMGRPTTWEEEELIDLEYYATKLKNKARKAMIEIAA